jgi:hypothetical protein
MSVVKEVVAELIDMFLAEKWLTIAVLGVVIVAGCLANFTELDPLVSGTMMLLGCLILLIESVWRAARTSAS